MTRIYLVIVLIAMLIFLNLAVFGCGDDGDSDDSGENDSGDDDDNDNDDNDDDDDDDTAPPDPFAGIYLIIGTDVQLGEYTGQAELRRDNDGTYSLYHVIEFDDAEFEGDIVAEAWEGVADVQGADLSVNVTLDRIGYVASYGDFQREPLLEPLSLQALFSQSRNGEFTGEFSSEDPPYSRNETWTYKKVGGDDPFWHMQRKMVPTHDPIPPVMKDLLFFIFSGYHAREELAPYLDREDFNEAIHYAVSDRTDFEFYRDNPNTLRVLQSIIDPISLVETRRRNRAYRMTLAEKAAWFDQNMEAYHIGPAGMLVSTTVEGETVTYHEDMSSMLWTGVYMASQAMRYITTGQQQALDNALAGLAGQVLCLDVVPEIGEFARSVRVHDENMPGDWTRGVGDFEDYDYMPGGNNDMMHGYEVGFFWLWQALPEDAQYDDERAEMIRVLTELLENNETAGDGEMHEIRFNMLLYYFTGENGYRQRYRRLLSFGPYRLWLNQMGNGSFYLWGISDWSGNHLNTQSLIVTTELARILEDPDLEMLKSGCRHALERMAPARLGLFLITMPLLGFDEPTEEFEEGVWTLREFPCPKFHNNIDHRINPGFSLSPFPSLPWKLDWAEPGSQRLFSLRSYAIFESGVDNFYWRGSPFGYTDGETNREDHSADYLFTYWFARYYNALSEDE